MAALDAYLKAEKDPVHHAILRKMRNDLNDTLNELEQQTLRRIPPRLVNPRTT